MEIVEIDLKIQEQGVSVFTATPELSGRTYQMKFTWNYRTQSWYLKINGLVSGIKVVNGIDLIGPYHYIDELPPGRLAVVRNTGRDSKPGFFNFGIGKEMTLIYEQP